MAIYPPGQRFRHNRILSSKGSRRSVVVTLSLTAMVDMFTVLVIFLLQNYNVTGEVLFIPKEITLPSAEKIKELKPAVVVTVSEKQIFVDREPVLPLSQVQSQTDWLIPELKVQVEQYLKLAQEKAVSKLNVRLQKAIGADTGVDAWRKVTVQADRKIDFGTIKKILYTVTEAGAGEINFAVTKEKK